MTDRLDLSRAPWRDRRPENQFYGYYISFEATGCEPVDEILRAIASAGKSAHHTEDWGESVDWIQRAAEAAAEAWKVKP